MPVTTRFLLHTDGPAIWPEHKTAEQWRMQQMTTPKHIWATTYQGQPSAPEGTIFKRSMFQDWRYDAESRNAASQVVARFQAWDTAAKAGDSNARSAGVVGELMSDYRLFIREVSADRLEFPALLPAISQLARRHNDGKLRAIVIEDKSSGTSAYQTLRSGAGADAWLSDLLVAFQPVGDKITRANQAAVWCENGSVCLPHPSESVPWLADFEDELFSFPGSDLADQVDAFSMLIIYCENLLAEGLRARQSAMEIL